MRNLDCSVLLVASLAAAAAAPLQAGTIITLAHTELPDGTPQPLTMKVDGRRVAIDGAAGESRMIFRGDEQRMLILDDDEKTYTVVDEAMVAGIAGQMEAAMKQIEDAIASLPPEQQEMARKMMKQQAAPPPQAGAGTAERVERTSERDTREGYPCVRYQVFDGTGTKVRELWVTDWSNVRGQDDLATAMKSMSAFADRLLASLSRYGGTGSGMQASIAQWSEIDGLPIVTTELENGVPSEETVLRSIEEARLEAEVFEPPQGYRPITLGDAGDGDSEDDGDGDSEDDGSGDD
jgi:hypothetical protein